jgi:glycosyltransferase involved in cell wall biosynthesis
METSPARGPSEPGPLVVTGMHRSGTSLLASFLRAAGVNLGERVLPADAANPLGYFEDLEFLELQREMLLACTMAESGWRDWGWTESQRLDFSRLPGFRPRAEALVGRREAAAGPWGWKDPRTTILLDFWHELLPNARYIFIYRAAWEVASSIAALHRSPFREHPDFVPRIWRFYNRQIQDFYRRHQDRCLLLEVGALLSRPDEVLARVRSKLGLLHQGPRDGAAILHGVSGKGRLGATASTARLWRLSAKSYPREAQVWAGLELVADLAAGFPVPAEPTPAPVDSRPAVQDSPAFSVVIPCFNDGEFLLAAVASAEDAEDAVLELIIVNDGSTDPFTIEVLDRLRAAGHRVLDQSNRGVGAARNAGIRASRGLYILPLDADNRIRPSYLRRAAEIFDASPAVGVVYGDAALSGKRSGLWRMPEFDLEQMATGNRIDACGAFRREVWEQCGGYDEDLQLGWEDWDFWLSVAERGWRFVHVPEVLFEYRLQSESISASGARQGDRRRMLEVIIAKHPAIFQPRLPRMFAEKDAHWLAADARSALLDEGLAEARGNLETARSEVDATRDALHTARSELEAVRGELQAARSELARWRERVEFMTGTRAWRLRSRLLRLRAALGLLPRS